MSHYLLVGANSGIGLELSRNILKEGKQISVISRTGDQLPDGVNFYPADVCQWGTELPVLDGDFNGLVYCPGSINLRPFQQLTLQDFQNDLDINFLGAVRVVQHYLPQMKPGASIVLISSVAARQGFSFHASISGAKAALEGFALAIAAELAPNIRVNVVAPSLTDTPGAQHLLNTGAKRESSAKRHPLHRIGAPEDVASAIAFLLSERSSWITGQVIGVDGGLSSLRPL